MICSRRPSGTIPQEILVKPIEREEGLLKGVAVHYFGGWALAQNIADGTGAAATLVDEIWEAQNQKSDMNNLPLIRLMAQLFLEQIDFVLWCGADFCDLPLIETWPELESELLEQTKLQPADVFMRVVPPCVNLNKPA